MPVPPVPGYRTSRKSDHLQSAVWLSGRLRDGQPMYGVRYLVPDRVHKVHNKQQPLPLPMSSARRDVLPPIADRQQFPLRLPNEDSPTGPIPTREPVWLRIQDQVLGYHLRNSSVLSVHKSGLLFPGTDRQR